METLADWVLEVDGSAFGLSDPERADFGPDPWAPGLAEFGVTAVDAPEVAKRVGAIARVLDPKGREVARLRIEAFDADLCVLSGAILAPAPQPVAGKARRVSVFSQLFQARMWLPRFTPRHA